MEKKKDFLLSVVGLAILLVGAVIVSVMSSFFSSQFAQLIIHYLSGLLSEGIICYTVLHKRGVRRFGAGCIVGGNPTW